MPDPAAPIASLWLLAAETDERDFVAEIERLAARHGTPVFHPHLTLLGDIPANPLALEAQIRAIAAAAPAFAAPVEDIVTSDLFFRSFYAGFPLGPELQALRAAAIGAFNLDPGPSRRMSRCSMGLFRPSPRPRAQQKWRHGGGGGRCGSTD